MGKRIGETIPPCEIETDSTSSPNNASCQSMLTEIMVSGLDLGHGGGEVSHPCFNEMKMELKQTNWSWSSKGMYSQNGTLRISLNSDWAFYYKFPLSSKTILWNQHIVFTLLNGISEENLICIQVILQPAARAMTPDWLYLSDYAFGFSICMRSTHN